VGTRSTTSHIHSLLPHRGLALNCLYLSKDDKGREVGIEIVPTVFRPVCGGSTTIHSDPEQQGRRGRWKMDPTIATDSAFKERFQAAWEKWRGHKRYYPTIAMWWERHVKPIKYLARQVASERNNDHNLPENHLYECMYEILKANVPETEKRPALQKYKAKIVQLHARRDKMLLGIHTKGRMDDEGPSLYHVLKQQKRRDTRAIAQIRDTDDTMHTTFRNIAATFVRHLAQKFGPLEVDPHALNSLATSSTDPQRYEAHLERPITMDEVYKAICAGARRKTPGMDGICLEFYITYWTTIKADLTHLLNDVSQQPHHNQTEARETTACKMG
jgi:hypothetical protein